jgi:trk system potassium uptake protein TrkH
VNFRSVAHSIACLLALEGVLMALCGLGSLFLFADPPAAWTALCYSSSGLLAFSLLTVALTRRAPELTRRDGLGIVAFGWLFACLAGALPFYFSGTIPDPAAAFFESVSGLTTTGATVLAAPELAPRGILLWRAISQLLGGVGVLVLLLAILPLAGAGGSQVFRAEMPGPTKDRIAPRIASTAKILWGVYLAFVAAVLLALRLAGMSWFDAVCHSFCTVSTGGFSTRAASIAAYASPAVEAIIAVGMFLGSCNFLLHWRFLRHGGFPYARDTEFRAFFLFLLVLVALVAAAVALGLGAAPAAPLADLPRILRHASFTVLSLTSSSGFSTVDYTPWPAAAQALLLVGALVGGMGGSTTGAIKVGRVLAMFSAISREIRLFLHPNAAVPVRYGRRVLPESLLLSIVGFVFLYFLVLLLGILLVLPFAPDVATSVSAAVACISNTGVGFAGVGPSSTYAVIAPPGHLVLAALMLLGRLEIYTILAVFLPSFWRK